MGFKLRREVRDAIPPGKLSAAERLLVLEIADWCNDKTRRGWPGAEFLAELTDLSPRSIQETLSRVAQKWIELRVPLGTDRAGKPYYSHAGKRTTFEFPELTPVKGAIDQGPCDATDPGASAREGATDPGGRCDGSAPKVRQIRGPSPQGSSSKNTSNPSFLADANSPKVPNPREGGDGEFDSDQQQRISTLVGEILTLRPNDRRWTDKSVRAAISKCLDVGRTLEEIERAFPACAADPATASPGRLPLPDFPWWDEGDNCPRCDGTALITAHDQRDREYKATCPDCSDPENPPERCPDHPRYPARTCGLCRSERHGARPDYSKDLDPQPRSSERGGYRARKVNLPDGQRTAQWEALRQQNRHEAYRNPPSDAAYDEWLERRPSLSRTETT